MKATFNKTEIMKEAHRMHNLSINADVNFYVSFDESLSWIWAIAKQSIRTYLQTGYANNDLFFII